MVSKVFPLDELENKTLEFARRIAERPTMASLLIKDSVNAASDAMGLHARRFGTRSTFTSWATRTGRLTTRNWFPVGLPPHVEDGTAKPTKLARRDEP